MAALKFILEEGFDRNFSIEENVNKNRFPNLKGWNLRSVERFCSDRGIAKRTSVTDETVCIAVKGLYQR